jgi:quercetin dioxygenase-like cupin family protein
MKHQHYSDVAREGVEGYSGVTVRWLISKNDGAPTFAMRLFEVEPGGASPYHQHEWEHEVFILQGTGVVKKEYGEEKFSKGDFFFIHPNEWHQFINTGKSVFQFLCLIPIQE